MAKPKKVKKNPTVNKGISAAKQGVKKRGSNKVIKKGIESLKKIREPFAKKIKRTREATKGDILRKGISNLKASNAALARFIAARYSAKAIAKYQDYAGRLKRSIRLRKQIVEIDTVTYRIKSYIIKTSADGKTPYSCTCPDFSQFSSEDRSWLGSKAGPFNPCKHMMAVRDRQKGGKWVCSSGVCTLDPLAVSGYATKAICEAAVIPPLFTGGQCSTQYSLIIISDIYRKERGVPSANYQYFSSDNYGVDATIYGAMNIKVVNNEGAEGTTTEVRLTGFRMSSGVLVAVDERIVGVLNTFSFIYKIIVTVPSPYPIRNDSLPDNCGNAAGSCPI